MSRTKNYQKILNRTRLKNITGPDGQTHKMTEGAIMDYFNAAKEWSYDIGYYLDEPSTEWQGHNYAKLILDGEVHATREVIAQVQQFQWMLENQGSKEWPHFWDEEAAFECVRILEKNVRIEDEENGGYKQLILQPFQQFLLGMLFGWKDEKGRLTTQELFILIGRGNAKTFLMLLAIIYYMAYVSTSKSFEAIYFAGTINLSTTLFQNAVSIIKNAEDDLKLRFTYTTDTIRLNDKLISRTKEKGRYVDVKPYEDSTASFTISSSNESHGLKTNMLFVDEVHTLGGEERYIKAIKAIINSFKKRKETIAMYASTRNEGFSEILEDYISERAKRLQSFKSYKKGTRNFAMLYYTEKGDDLSDIRYWLKSNPLLFNIGDPLSLLDEYLTHVKDPQSLDARVFWSQHLNLLDFTERHVYLTANHLKTNNGTYERESLRGKTAYIGIDLAMGGDDFTAVYTLIPEMIEGQKRLYVEGRSFTTESKYKQKKEQIAYYPNLERWVAEGVLETTSDTDINGWPVEAYLRSLYEFYDVKVVAYDPAFIKGKLPIYKEIFKDTEFKAVKQTGDTISEPTLMLQQQFKDGVVHFNNDSLTSYYLRNAEMMKRGQFYSIAKPRNREGDSKYYQIDGTAAMIIAYEPFNSSGGFRMLEDDVKVDSRPSAGDKLAKLRALRG